MFETLAAGKPESAEAQYFLGLIAKDQNDLELAYLHLHKAVLLNPDKAGYVRDYFKVICVRGDLQEAGHVFEKLKTLGEDDFDVISRFSKLIFEKGAPPAQAAIASLMIQRYPRLDIPYLKLGEIYERAGQNWDVLKVYQQMVTQLPQESQAYLRLAMAYKVLKKKKESKSYLNKALQLDPSLKKNKDLRRAFED